MMALVTVGWSAPASPSPDMGIAPAIAYNRRGDDPVFLDTAWTLQVSRGFFLWFGTCALALPVAHFMVSRCWRNVAGGGSSCAARRRFNPTSIEIAHRHLMPRAGDATDLSSQVIGTVAMVVLARATRSIWSPCSAASSGATRSWCSA